MSIDTSTPVNISDLYQMACTGGIQDLHNVLSRVSSDRLEALIAWICYELQYIDIHKAAPFRCILNTAIDINRTRKSDEAFDRLMDGVA